ncbi:MAG: HAD-IA family hydrolase [Vulcanococcus sp.]
MAAFPAALLWDVDGTLAETELEGHRCAFNRAFADAGDPWRWERTHYLELLRISGGRERLRAFLREAEGEDPSAERVEALQLAKQRHYSALVAGGELQLRPGVARLMAEAAAAGVVQGIVTTSGRPAVAALLEQLLPERLADLQLRICGEDVQRKKPDAEAYRLALAQLDLPAAAALAIEDSGNGVAAAHGAGLPVLVTRSAASAAEADGHFALATAQLDHLGEPLQPCAVRQGPACPEGHVTLSWLEQLLPAR